MKALPQEDSPDLTDEQVAQARGSSDLNALAVPINDSRCPQCERIGLDFTYAVRRRKPHIYVVVTQRCSLNHSWDLIFETDWLERA